MRTQGLVGRRSSQDSHIGILKLFFLFVIFITIYNFFFGQFDLPKTLELKRSLIDMESKRKEVEKENVKLERLLNAIDRNPEYYREIFIREYMQLQREDEKIILFYDR